MANFDYGGRTVCPPHAARVVGDFKPRSGACMEFHRDIGRIPESMKSTKVQLVAPAVWVYRRGAAGQGLVKGKRGLFLAIWEIEPME